jgi:hypothetical protein
MVERVFRALALAVALLAPAVAAAAPAQMTRVPALFQGGQIYVRVSLDGAAPVWMAFDIDATGSTLYAAHAPRAVVRAGSVAEPVTFRPSAAAAPCAPDGSVVAGRLGSDWLGDRVAEIRTRAHEVWLSEPVTPAPPALARPLMTASRSD